MPNEIKEFLYDQGGNATHEVRNPGDFWEEIIDLKTGKSTLKTHRLESVLNPEGCSHDFRTIDMGKREAECSKCRVGVTYIVGQTLKVSAGDSKVYYHGKYFPLSL